MTDSDAAARRAVEFLEAIGNKPDLNSDAPRWANTGMRWAWLAGYLAAIEDQATGTVSGTPFPSRSREEEAVPEPPAPVTRSARPEIVVLCGSTRFYDEFRRQNLRLTLEGRIVLSIGCDTKSDGDLFGQDDVEALKTRLDELHKHKIDLADRVLVLNVGGYIGESTRSEIYHAQRQGKSIDYLEPIVQPEICAFCLEPVAGHTEAEAASCRIEIRSAS